MPAKTRDRFKVFESKPPLGGILITRGSADNATHLNYTRKQDWRRDLDVEVRREGLDYFYPNLTLPVGGQPFPSQVTVDLLTFSGGTATATHFQGHHFESGESIIISGATDPAYNGTFTITNITANTFGYTPLSVPAVSPDPSTTITAAAKETINLIAMARRPNGQTAVIAGSQRRLYRYYALEDPDYISRDPADYPPGTAVDQLSYWSDGTLFPADAAAYPPGTPTVEQQYVDTNPGFWIVIGSGYSLRGKRWEAVSINGYMVFNNGVNLLCTYRVEDLNVVPIYELREQGISAVGTISEINGILMCGDISEIQPDQLANWFNIAADPYQVYPFAQYIQRTTYQIIWGTPSEPRRWALVVPGSINANSNVLTMQYPVKGFNVGQNITITGAGTSHAGATADNLAGNIVNVNGATIIIDVFAQTTVTDAPVIATDAIDSIVGLEDLQDDGSGIVKMLPLADQLVIYKDTSIFLAQYLGSPAQPFAFAPRRVQKEQSIYYRNTLALVETPTEMFHVYAGRNSFYRFDLTNQQPMIMAHFESCSNLFFDQATLAETESIFVFENGITHELNFVFPSDTSDQQLCWDYKQDTMATSSVLITAGATIRKPITGLAAGAEKDWCVLGNNQGTVMIYGLVDDPEALPNWNNGKAIWFRRESNPYNAAKGGYPSTLRSGLGTFGNDFGEKDVRALVALLASQSPGSVLTINLYGAQNADDALSLLGSKLFTSILTRSLMPVSFRRFLFMSEIVINGVDDPSRLVGLVWSVAPVDSRSIPRA